MTELLAILLMFGVMAPVPEQRNFTGKYKIYCNIPEEDFTDIVVRDLNLKQSKEFIKKNPQFKNCEMVKIYKEDDSER